jgi:glycosyltransferase involved in cell wall biosynthesis
METAFRGHYPTVSRTIVVPNVVPGPPQLAAVSQRQAFIIGMVSNLMFEKGVREFVELFEAACTAGISVSAILAGPAWNEEMASYLNDAVARNDGKLEWAGPVYGEAKERFFASIDAFVFPSRYASECYPLVIVEALARGKPVISTDQGCISALATSSSVHIVPKQQDFIKTALPIMGWLAALPREQYFAQALADAAAINAHATQACERLIEQIVRG